MKTVSFLSGAALPSDAEDAHTSHIVHHSKGDIHRQVKLSNRGIVISGAKAKVFIPLEVLLQFSESIDPTITAPTGLNQVLSKESSIRNAAASLRTQEKSGISETK
jgi:hypothetical protein